jgi:hypothetical protein
VKVISVVAQFVKAVTGTRVVPWVKSTYPEEPKLLPFIFMDVPAGGLE